MATEKVLKCEICKSFFSYSYDDTGDLNLQRVFSKIVVGKFVLFEVCQELKLKSGLRSEKIIYCVPFSLQKLTIGRKSTNQFVVPHKLHQAQSISVSREHAILEFRDDKIYLKDN